MIVPNEVAKRIGLSAVFLFSYLAVGVAGETAPGSAKGNTSMIDQETVQLMSRLDTLDERSRIKLVSQVDDQRNQLLNILVKYIDTSPSTNVRAAAIYIIGRHRLSEAAPELIQHIDFDAGEAPRSGSLPLWGRFPAAEALITIGLPSVAPAIELLASDANELRRDLATKVIRYVEGYDVSKFILDRAFSAETGANRKARLAEAVARLERLPRN